MKSWNVDCGYDDVMLMWCEWIETNLNNFTPSPRYESSISIIHAAASLVSRLMMTLMMFGVAGNGSNVYAIVDFYATDEMKLLDSFPILSWNVERETRDK